jgi:hypothetical protein
MTTTRRHPGDPEHDARVVLVLAAAAAPSEPGAQPGEAAVLAAFRDTVPTPTRRTRMLPTLKAAAVAAAATGALLTGGIAAASTGTLPGAAQDTAQTALAKVGVTVPGPADAAAEHPASRGRSATAAAETSTTPAPVVPSAAPEEANAHGKAVSELATTTPLTGKDKGVAISTLASQGRARAHRPTATPTAAPETGATETGATASADGQSTADAHSAGRSSTGTAHRP